MRQLAINLSQSDDEGTDCTTSETSTETAKYHCSEEVRSEQIIEKSTKGSKQKTGGRSKWTNEMSESLIAFLSDIKSKMELKGLDFESDLVKLYTEPRIMMSGMYDESDFGPISLSELDKTVNNDELAAQRLKLSEEKKLVKTGYHRVKEKVKALRQDYRKAVTEGRRSGSGRLVCDNWDILKLLWGGSPATVSLSNSSASLKEIQNDDDIFDGG